MKPHDLETPEGGAQLAISTCRQMDLPKLVHSLELRSSKTYRVQANHFLNADATMGVSRVRLY